MPAMLDDPTSPTVYRVSGATPFPDPHDPQPALPFDVLPRHVTLRDRITVATIVPFSSQHQVPSSLLAYLSDQLNKEIENGDTYPMMNGMPPEQFSSYWFQNFGAIMLLGNIESVDEIVDGRDWAKECLGSFYIKPNYPGRSSHVCNAGFLVTDAARGRGAGRLMGESYLDWAPKLGYVYSVFNLVYETNVASCRIWDALGFKRIGKVKGAGSLKSYPGQLIDAIIYGRDLGPEGEDFVSEERFDKIKFYLKTGKYPAGADRAEKSRLRSAATHYKLIAETDKLMLKDKEVISDPQRQYEIARNIHIQNHGGINKTTATIAEKYHWVRIKETVSLVIRNCTNCKDLGKAPVILKMDNSKVIVRPSPVAQTVPATCKQTHEPLPMTHSPHQQQLQLEHQEAHHHPQHASDEKGFPAVAGQGSVSPQVLNRTLPRNNTAPTSHPQQLHSSIHPPMQLSPSSAPIARMNENDYMPLDPQIMDSHIMEDVQHHLGEYNDNSHHHNRQHSTSDFQDHHNHNEFHDQGHDSFFHVNHSMLSAPHKQSNDGTVHDGTETEHGDGMGEDHDLDMLIDQEDGEGEEYSDVERNGPEGKYEHNEVRTNYANGTREDGYSRGSRSHDGDGDTDHEDEAVIQLHAEAARAAAALDEDIGSELHNGMHDDGMGD